MSGVEARRTRVLHLVLQLGRGGMEAMIASLAAGADRRRFDVEVWSLDLGGEMVEVLRREGVPVRVLDKGTGFRFSFLRRLRRELAQGRFDLLHAHNAPAARWAIVGTLGSPTRPVLVRTDHTYNPRKRWSMTAGHLLTGAWYAAMIGVSESTTAAHRRIDPVWASRYRTIPNGIPMQAPLPSRDAARAVLQGLGVAPADRIVASVGNLREPKGQDVLIEATARVIARCPDVQLVVFGEGPLRGLLESQARGLGIAGRVHLVGARSDAPELLTAADLYVQSSRREGMPVSLLEASRAACPIVATEVGGTREVLDDGRCGILVPAGDAGALAQAMLDQLADRSAARALGERAREFARGSFDSADVARRTEALYDELLRKRLASRW